MSVNSAPSSSPSSTFSLRRKPKPPKGEFLRWDTTDVANHLTLMESRSYNKIRPHECLSWTRSTKGPAVINLTNFIGTSDRLAAWVKLSILTCESLGKRADMIDHWIKIAEVRRRSPRPHPLMQHHSILSIIFSLPVSLMCTC